MSVLNVLGWTILVLFASYIVPYLVARAITDGRCNGILDAANKLEDSKKEDKK